MPTNRITALRAAAGLKPVDVASRMGVGERTVVRWERGEGQIPDEQKLRLAELLDVSVSFMMGWPDRQNEPDRKVAA
jgi:DNA-binding transcriptional regulator YiaG